VGGAVRSFHGEPAVGRRVGREHLIPRSFLDEMPAQARWRYVGEIKRLHDVYSVDGPFAKGNPAVREQVDYVISEPPFAEPYDEESVELRTLPSAARRSVPLWRRSPIGLRPARSEPSQLVLRLFAPDDAAHYAKEWGAHLWELNAEGQHRQARRDRRRMALSAPWLALQLRTRAFLRLRPGGGR